jgi:hypothetical protein
LVEVREVLPEGRDPSPSVAAFNTSFSTLYRGELLSVGCEVSRNKGGAPKILTLWKSSALIDETGGEGSEQSLRSHGGAVRDSGKEPRSSLQKTPASLGKSPSGSGKKVTLQNLSRHGSTIFVNSCTSQLLRIFAHDFNHGTFQNLRTFFVRTRPNLRSFKKIMLLNLPCLGKLPLNGSLIKRR